MMCRHLNTRVLMSLTPGEQRWECKDCGASNEEVGADELARMVFVWALIFSLAFGAAALYYAGGA
jgi:hypothetical protein